MLIKDHLKYVFLNSDILSSQGQTNLYIAAIQLNHSRDHMKIDMRLFLVVQGMSHTVDYLRVSSSIVFKQLRGVLSLLSEIG